MDVTKQAHHIVENEADRINRNATRAVEIMHHHSRAKWVRSKWRWRGCSIAFVIACISVAINPRPHWHLLWTLAIAAPIITAEIIGYRKGRA